MQKQNSRSIMIVVLVVLGALAWFNCSYIVKENEYAYVTRFSKFVTMHNTAGMKFKMPFLDTIETLPKYRMMYDIPPSDVLTSDKKTLVVDNFAVWQIDDPYTFMKTVTRVSEMQNRIGAVVYNAVKNTLGTMEQTSIINADTGSIDKVNESITHMVNEQLKSYGVSIVSVEIKRLDLPSENEEAVYARMISERNQMTESYKAGGKLEAQKLQNETDKEVQIIKSKAEADAKELEGQGESEYMRIIAEAYSSSDRVEYYNFIRSLEALKTSIKGEKTIILPADSPIVRALNNN